MKKKFTKILSLTLILFAVFFLAITVSSQAADRYISPTGNDVTGAGTLASPWKTIAKASTGMAAGETVWARGGTYLGQFGRGWKSSGSSGNPVTLKNYGTEIPIFDGEWGAGPDCCDGEFLTITNLSWVVIDGIHITKYNDPYGDGAIGINNSGGAVNNITVQNCKFYDNGTDANAQNNDHHVYIGSGATDVIIRNNRFERAPGGAIHAYHTPAMDRIKIYNNVIIGGTSSNYVGNQQWGIIIADGRNTEIYNNTIYNVAFGICFDWGQPASVNPTPNAYTVKNNILSNCTTGIFVSTTNVADHPNYGQYYSSDYNLFYSNTTDVRYGGTNYTASAFAAATVHETNYVSGNPLFVSSTDLHLQSTSSAAYNEGTSGGNIPTYDKDYLTRSVSYDIGAYEFDGCSAPYAPDPPTSPSATAISSSQINLAWTDASGVEEDYEIERSLSAGSGFAWIATVAAGSTAYNNTTGLSANTTYYYRIRGTNCFGNGSYSTVVNATTCPATIPTAPLHPAATPFSNSRIDVVWYDNSGIETNYLIERSLNSTINFTQVGSVGANVTTFSDNTGLSANTKYYYRVRAWNCTGYTTYTTTVSATTTPTCSPGSAPGAPTGPSATVGSGAQGQGTFQITVAWTNGTGTRTGNVVERSTNATYGFTQVANLGSATTSYVDWGLSSGTLYYYRIRSVNCNGNSGYISTSATTNACSPTNPNGTPTTPTSPTTGSVTSSSITVGWTDWSGIEAAYIIERSLVSGSGFVEIGRVNPAVSGTLSYVDAGLSSSTTYYYRVWAWNCNGLSTQTGVPGGAGYISANATTASGFMSAPSTTTSTTTVVSEPVISKEIVVYPNPSVTSFVLSIPSDVILKGASMKIYDRYGKQVKSVSISSNITVIERGSLQSGIYYYHIMNNNAKISDGKLMISSE